MQIAHARIENSRVYFANCAELQIAHIPNSDHHPRQRFMMTIMMTIMATCELR